MIVNASIKWKRVPASFTVEVENGEFLGGSVMVGAGRLLGIRYGFASTGEGKITMRLKASDDEANFPTVVRATGPKQPVEFRLCDVPTGRALFLDDGNVEIWAEEDAWASL